MQLHWPCIMVKTVNIHGFPSCISAGRVKTFLEQITGEGTVYAIKVRQGKTGRRSYAIVQFMRVEDADRIIRMAGVQWRYEGSYLTARKVDHDIVPRPRVSSHSIDGVTLHFGCQISEQKFLTLWEKQGVSVDFGIGSRRFNFVLSHNDTEYKLGLSYENIWQIELRRQQGRGKVYLLIQVLLYTVTVTIHFFLFLLGTDYGIMMSCKTFVALNHFFQIPF